ncbi:polysaccharide deacetylase family protein [Microbulbifer sp. S227A]|uniref:polysaccharide deacetylase family protein n=1 Tax=Microbulbifer sp. S227A TaxID=3415131 RepID=UPI003C7DFF5F
MTPDWTPLDAELDRWKAAGLTLPLWWRDDDAITATPQLERLHDLARRLDMPVHLAVIPAHAQPSLTGVIGPHMVPVLHGWAHANHAPPHEKKAEFGAHRDPGTLLAELERGRARLRTLFGDALAPMFVPPWNRIAADLPARLPGLGLRMLSTFTPRARADAAPGLRQINTHLDPINWRAGKTLHDPDTLIRQVADQLADRRENRADPAEPYGILTHHLVHDAAIWDHTEALLTRLLNGPAQIWTAHAGETTNEPT